MIQAFWGRQSQDLKRESTKESNCFWIISPKRGQARSKGKDEILLITSACQAKGRKQGPRSSCLPASQPLWLTLPPSCAVTRASAGATLAASLKEWGWLGEASAAGVSVCQAWWCPPQHPHPLEKGLTSSVPNRNAEQIFPRDTASHLPLSLCELYSLATLSIKQAVTGQPENRIIM